MGRRSKRAGIDGLSKLEARIMDLVWDRDEISVREVHETLVKEEYLPYTTVMATMVNLSKRGILKQDKTGKTYYYSPSMSRIDAAEAMIDAVVENVLGNRREAVKDLIERLTEKYA